jgi:hypothetical protein
MPELRNARHEQFALLVASGLKPTEAYIFLDYRKAGARGVARNLHKRADVRARVNEIQSLAARSSAEEVAFDRKRVLNRLDVLSRKAEEHGEISVAVHCEELIGKACGMFDRSHHKFEWSGDLSDLSDSQLEAFEKSVIKRYGLADEGPAALVVIDAESTRNASLGRPAA